MNFLEHENEKIEKLVLVLKRCKSVLFITGAGISADSGLPTYRGIGGLYNNKQTDEGLAIEDALSGDMLTSRPEVSWKYIFQIEEACRGAKFNRAQEVVAEMERHFPRVWTLTQNIDGFHRDAGSKKIIDIHGDIHSLHCLRCDYSAWVENYESLKIPPRCPECKAIVRPQVVLFGEMLPVDKCEILHRELETGFDIVFSIGTTSVFPYIAQPVLDASRRDIATVEINPGDTPVTPYVDYKFHSGAAVTLDEIWKRYRNVI
jgi:NAD-dependent deacetylase